MSTWWALRGNPPSLIPTFRPPTPQYLNDSASWQARPKFNTPQAFRELLRLLSSPRMRECDCANLLDTYTNFHEQGDSASFFLLKMDKLLDII